jgi:hypothetical protein
LAVDDGMTLYGLPYRSELFREEFNDLDDWFWAEIRDLYDAEKRLTRALPRMARTRPNACGAIREMLRK